MEHIKEVLEDLNKAKQAEMKAVGLRRDIEESLKQMVVREGFPTEVISINYNQLRRLLR